MRRGFSTVIVGGLIIFILSVLAAIYFVYLDANQYKLTQAGESISNDLRRESERLHVYMVGNEIRIRNVGSIPVRIKYLAEKLDSGVKLREVNLTIDVGRETSIGTLDIDPSRLLLISSRGRIYTVDNTSISARYLDDVFRWVNSTYFTIDIPLNITDSLYPLENSILTISSREYGYIVLDLLRGEVIYQGRSLIIPSRDGGVIYANGKVYIGSRKVLGGLLSLEYVGYDYLVVSSLNYLYLVVSDGSLYTYTSNDSIPRMFYNGMHLIVIGFIGVVQDMYRYYVAYISPFNYTLISLEYLDLPIKLANFRPPNILLPSSSTIYLDSSTSPQNMVAITSYSINSDVGMLHVFSSDLGRSDGSLSWMYRYWYFNIDGGIKNSTIDYVESMSTLDTGLPMDWQVTVRNFETPYSDEDIRVYNLSSSIGFLSIDSKFTYGYAGLVQNGIHRYKYVLGGDPDSLEIEVTIYLSNGDTSLNISIYSLIPSRELIGSYKGRLLRPIISLDLYLSSLMGRGALHIYDAALINPYIDTLTFEFTKPDSNLLLKVINSTEVLVTSNYQYSIMRVKVFVFDGDGFFYNPSTLDYLVDGRLNSNSIHISSNYVVVGSQNLALDYVNKSVSIKVGYGDPTAIYSSTYLMLLPEMSWIALSSIDGVGLYMIDRNGPKWYQVGVKERYDWDVITYNLVYILISTRFGGVDIYVYKY